MKKLILIAAVLLTFNVTAFAQNYFIVNSEKIFKSIDAYNDAIAQLDKLEQTFQTNIDNAYETIEGQYTTYKEQSSYLSEADRKTKEDQIVENERRVTEYREATLGDEGELMKKRMELIKPIQDKVFKAISDYATRNNFTMALDIATTPSVIFYTPEIDKTETLIKLLETK